MTPIEAQAVEKVLAENRRLAAQVARLQRLNYALEQRLAAQDPKTPRLGDLSKDGKTPLTNKQRDILEYVRWCAERNGMPPTHQEIADHFDFSSTNASDAHVRALVAKGWLQRIPGKSRGLRVLP